MANKPQSKEQLEKELYCCANCISVMNAADKGTKYCTNTESKFYEEKKTPANGKCEKFKPKIKI